MRASLVVDKEKFRKDLDELIEKAEIILSDCSNCDLSAASIDKLQQRINNWVKITIELLSLSYSDIENDFLTKFTDAGEYNFERMVMISKGADPENPKMRIHALIHKLTHKIKIAVFARARIPFTSTSMDIP